MLGEPLALRDMRLLREGVTEGDSNGVTVVDALFASDGDAFAEREADCVADSRPLTLFVSDALPLVEGELVGDTRTDALQLLETEARPDNDAHAVTLFDTLALAVCDGHAVELGESVALGLPLEPADCDGASVGDEEAEDDPLCDSVRESSADNDAEGEDCADGVERALTVAHALTLPSTVPVRDADALLLAVGERDPDDEPVAHTMSLALLVAQAVERRERDAAEDDDASEESELVGELRADTLLLCV